MLTVFSHNAGALRFYLEKLKYAVDPDDPGVDVLTLDPSIDPRGIQLTRRAGRSLPPAADHFTALAHGVAAEVFERDVSLVD